MTEKKTTKKKPKPKTIWETLSRIDCSDHVEKKGGFNYLSWAWAWGMLMEHYPDATFENHLNEVGYPCFLDQEGNAMVCVSLSILGKTHTEHLPVLDYRNKPISHPDSFSVNTALKRCLVKAMAYFGLGHYIYAGEDLPSDCDGKQESLQRKSMLALITAYIKFDASIGWEDKIKKHFDVKGFEDLTDKQLKQLTDKLNNKEKANDKGKN